jgi:hypothetical protein
MSTTTTDTAVLEQDISRARQDLGQTLFVLGDRIAPKKLVARVKEQVQFKAAMKVEELKERFLPSRVLRRKFGTDRSALETGVSSGRLGLPRG